MTKKKASKHKPKGRFILLYVEHCSPKIKYFSTLNQASKFIKAFHADNPVGQVSSDNWLDVLIYGEVAEEFEGWRDSR